MRGGICFSLGAEQIKSMFYSTKDNMVVKIKQKNLLIVKSVSELVESKPATDDHLDINISY